MRDFRKSDKFIFDFEKGGWVLNTNYGAEALGYNSSSASDFSIARDDEEGFFGQKEERSKARSAWGFMLFANLFEGSQLEGKNKKRRNGQTRWRNYFSTSEDPYYKLPLPPKAFTIENESKGFDVSASKPWKNENFDGAIRKLPKKICEKCKYFPACSSWLDGRVICGGIRPCLKLKLESGQTYV